MKLTLGKFLEKTGSDSAPLTDTLSVSWKAGGNCGSRGVGVLGRQRIRVRHPWLQTTVSPLKFGTKISGGVLLKLQIPGP